jgi:MFS family permease
MTEPAADSHRAIMRSISGLLLATFFATLSTNILATALPTILPSLHVSVDGYTWVVTTYILMLTVSVPVWGKLADLWPKKLVLQAALVLYLAGSLVGGGATSAVVLIIGRAVQGLGTGGLAALGQVVLASLIAPRQRGRYSGYSGAVFALGTVVGPLAGGLLVTTPVLAWRACFLVSMPFGLLSLYLIQRHLHLPKAVGRTASVDLSGAALLIAASSTVLIWMSLAGNRFRWWSWPTLAAGLVTALLTIAFVLVETRAAEPLVRLSLFRNRSVSLAAAASFFSGIVAFATPLFLAQYFQLGRGFSAAQSGVETLPVIAGIFTASWGAGRLITVTGRTKPFLIFGTLAQLLGVAGFAWAPDHSSPQWLIVPMFVAGLGIGVLQQNIVLFVQNVIPAGDLGSGSAATQFCRFLGGALGVSALGALSAARVNVHVTRGLQAIGRQLPAGTGIPDLRVLPPMIAAVYERGYTQAFADLFAALLPFLLVPVVAVLLMRDVFLAEAVRTVPDEVVPRETRPLPEK